MWRDAGVGVGRGDDAIDAVAFEVFTGVVKEGTTRRTDIGIVGRKRALDDAEVEGGMSIGVVAHYIYGAVIAVIGKNRHVVATWIEGLPGAIHLQPKGVEGRCYGQGFVPGRNDDTDQREGFQHGKTITPLDVGTHIRPENRTACSALPEI
jgi:hypothetical protein